MTFHAESFQLSLSNQIETARFVVEKITDTFLGQDNKIYYKVRWQETWEPEERMMALCPPLVNDFWKEYYTRTQLQQQQQQQQQAGSSSVINPSITPVGSVPKQTNVNKTNQYQTGFNANESQINSEQRTPAVASCSISTESTLSATLVTANMQNQVHSGLAQLDTNVSHTTTVTQPTLHQIQGVNQYRVHGNLIEKRPTQMFLEPRFLNGNPMMSTQRFQLAPYVVPGQASSDEIMTKVLDKIPEPLSTNTRTESDKLPHMSTTELLHDKTRNNKKHFCLICQKDFKNKSMLKNHDAVYHPSGTLICETCGKVFSKKQALNRHKLSHTTLRPHICTQCGKGFKERSNLSKHMVIHSGIRPHVCEICNARFRQLGHLFKHRLVHKPDKPFKCDTCEKGFKRKEHLKEHMIIHTTEFPYQCEICDKKFRFRTNLKVHVLQHDGRKDFVCDVCNKAFSGKANLAQHQTVHKAEFEFPCDICQKKFRRKGHLKRHVEIHKNDSQLSCAFCKEQFLSKATYRQHLLTHAGGSKSKPFKCVMCDKRFATKTFLTTHVQSHTTNTPNQNAANLNSKLKPTLKPKLEIKHECQYCKRLFRRALTLTKHQKICPSTPIEKGHNVEGEKAPADGGSELTDVTKDTTGLKKITSQVSSTAEKEGAFSSAISIENLIGNTSESSGLARSKVYSVDKTCILLGSEAKRSSHEKTNSERLFESLVLPGSVVKQ